MPPPPAPPVMPPAIPPPAPAAIPPMIPVADKLFAEGMEALQQGRNERALELFAAAYFPGGIFLSISSCLVAVSSERAASSCPGS